MASTHLLYSISHSNIDTHTLFATLVKQCSNNHLSDHFQVVKNDALKQTMIDKGKEMLANAQVKHI